MFTAIQMTRDEKIALYMQMNKRELAEMLESANAALNARTPTGCGTPQTGGTNIALSASE